MILSELERYNRIVVQIHDNPDADAVGSGYSIYRYFLSRGKDVRLIYGGRNVVSKSNMKLMIEKLGIPLEYAGGDGENIELDNPELLITVDCQYGQGNVQRFEAQNVAMIDHHNTGRKSDDMAEIRPNLISCATVCYALLKNEGFEVNEDINIATALYYGLYMDSNRFSEISHPLDRDMVDFLRYDSLLFKQLKYANFSLAELEIAGVAISNKIYFPEYKLAVVRAEPCDPNMLGVIGDFVIQVDSIDICIIYNECFGGYKLSVRSCLTEAEANRYVSYITEGIGNGGGHNSKAGGFISRDRFIESCEGKLEQYIEVKTGEYFSSYSVVKYNDSNVDLSDSTNDCLLRRGVPNKERDI